MLDNCRCCGALEEDCSMYEVCGQRRRICRSGSSSASRQQLWLVTTWADVVVSMSANCVCVCLWAVRGELPPDWTHRVSDVRRCGLRWSSAVGCVYVCWLHAAHLAEAGLCHWYDSAGLCHWYDSSKTVTYVVLINCESRKNAGIRLKLWSVDCCVTSLFFARTPLPSPLTRTFHWHSFRCIPAFLLLLLPTHAHSPLHVCTMACRLPAAKTITLSN